MSHKPLAFLNGRMIPAAELTIPVYDAGFVLGATVSEQLRTFGGKLYKLEEHLARLQRGLEITGIDAGCSVEQLAASANELAAANHRLLDPADDLGLTIFITPGPYATFAPPEVERRATIGMSTYALPFQLWADKYERGERLSTSGMRQVDKASWPRDMKHRSRMHYYLADQAARRDHPGTRPLLLDKYGYVNETPTANVVAFRASEGIVSPPRSEILPGITLAALAELSESFGVPFVERSLSLDDLRSADEAWLTSTPFCLLPVTQLDDAPIGDGRPGPVYRKLLEAWGKQVGFALPTQAQRFALRPATSS